ncbi:hypothetical protein BOX15_Mlig019034g1 [Macrostomum lignano]|uniref:VWFA domain-containing protein n=2 Tax=Macrostomum lignano TaxID=282301 RepID=A0A267FQ87_9PLAT|nr:hypothetical protein BOX15_Mlig019034g1 [Macrostomum lignano]
MRMLASATSLMLVATALLTTVRAHPKTGLSPTVRDPVVKCGNADYVIVLNLQRKDFDSLTAYQQQMTAVVARARLLTENDIGVGFVAFSKKVEHTIPVTRNLTLVQRKLNRLLSQLPRFDGIATGDAMLAAKHLLAKYHHQLVEVGRRKCKLLAVVAVGGDRNAGTHRTFAASTQLRRVASHVFAVNLAGGASPKELYRIASDGTRGIFDASNIVEVLTKTEAYAQVFCPCPLSWTTYDNCTVRGRAQVQRFFYNRSEELPHNCIRKLAISFEPCDCPPNRVERSECVNGFIRISTFVYSRPDNNSDCTESVTTQTEACGRATGCESFVCPPGSVCVNGTNNTIRCNCTNPNDIFKTNGCESCGDRSPLTRYGPCINRQRTVVVTTFTRINDTYCHHVFNMRKENCSACQGSGSRQFGPCVRGYQQVTVTLYRLRGGRCYKSLKTFQRPCRLQSEYQCIGSALSGGQFLTYDGQLIDFPGPCEYLLSERQGHFQVRVRHAIKFPSLPQLTQLDAIVIVMGNRSYELANNLVFKVGAVAQPLPYSDAASGVEAIYSDDALVFAAGDLYVQMRGSAATINVRSGAGGLRGILGNCNGSPGDDFTNSSGQDVSQQANPSAALGNSFRLTTCSTADCCSLPDTAPACGTNASMEAASVSNCGHLTADAMSPFAHCGQTAMQPLFRACISLYCRAKANKMWQRSLVCSTLEAAAFRCYLQQQNGTHRSRYPIFRSSNFCPKSCGHNAEFVDDADFCPRTCARHFFNSQSLGCVTPFGFRSRNVNGQSPLPGCQCKPGFVLDGSNCVLPNECECISNLCIDRQNRTVCEAWKAQGYCDKYPLQMRRYCKLTCDQCQAPCQDQISKTTCQTIKSQGRCGDSFYKQMCQLTCNPSDCECPPCKTVRGPCDSQNKNRRVVTYCYAPDSNGRCQRSQSSSVYEPCGDCQEQQQRVDTRSCNYCTQEQVTRIVRTVRETTGEMRCIEVNSNMTTRSPGCECQTNTNRTVCYRNSELYVINTVSAPSADCATCNTTVTETRLRNVTCTKVVKRGECDQVVTKRRPVTVTRGIVRNCQCDLITEQYEEMCVCPKPHWTPTICHRNRAKLRWFVAFSLVHGRCVPIVKPHKHRVPCPRRHHVKYKCKSCNRYKLHSWYERRHCRCIRKKKTVEAGRCCCPKPKKVRGECIGQHRRILITHYTLDNYECQEDTREISERCGCPPSRPIKECDGETGMITVGKLVFKLVDGTCEEVRQVKTEPTVCKKMRVIRRGPCRLLKEDDVVKYRRVYYELWKRIRGDCKCKHIKRSKLVACGCREPQVRVSKCPSGCPTTSRSCPEHCYRTRAVVEYHLEDGKCHPEERDQQDLPCCCEKPRNKPPVCENGKILAILKYHVQLVANACKIKKHVVRKDVTRHCDLTDVRRMRHGDVIIVKRRVVRNCRCIWRERRTSCPARCPPPSKFVRCDGATGERVLIKRFYKMHSCHCLPVKRIRRLPVDCPEPRIERRNFCFRENPAVIIRRINFYVDGECHCKKKVSEKRYRCEGEVCDQRPSVRLHCHANRLYNVVTLFKRDEEGRCAPHEFKHRVETPPCTGHGKRKKVKKCVNGKLILLINWLERRHCKCHTRYRKRVIGSCNSYCEHRNRGKSLRTRRRCNKHTNELVVYRLKWNFDGDHCVRRWVATNKRVEPDCPGPRLRRLPCDHETGKQRLEKLVYHMRNCKCRGPKLKVSYRKCTCRGPKVLGRYCDHRHGCIVVRMLIHKWNFEMDACHTRLVRKSIPVPCKHHIHSSHGACIHGHMQYRRTRYVRDRHNCRCRKKIEKKLVNCHCPVVIRRKKCNDRRSVAVTRIVYRKFSTKKRRCVTVKVKRHHRKCRCPKPKEVKNLPQAAGRSIH